MPTTQQLREQRANIWEQMQATMAQAEKDGWNGELEQSYATAEADLDRLGNDIARADRHAGLVDQFNRVEAPGAAAQDPADREPATARDQAYTEAFATYLRQGPNALNHEQQNLLHTGRVEAPANAAGVGTGSAGGYTVPPAFRDKVIERIQFVAAMRQLAEVITTETGASLPWTTVDETGVEGRIIAENTQVTETDATFGTASLDAYMYSSDLTRVSLQLLNDTAFDLEGWLANALGARIGRVQNRHFTVGTGTNQPDGIVTSAGVGASAAVNAISYDNLVDLTDSIDPIYLSGGNNRFMLSQAARKVIRKLKDGQGRPLWEPSLQAGTPDNVLGYGTVLNNYVPAPGANAKSVLFGDFREAYVIRDVQGFALMRLTERFADYFQVGFVGFQRSDGTLQNAAAVKALQHASA